MDALGHLLEIAKIIEGATIPEDQDDRNEVAKHLLWLVEIELNKVNEALWEANNG